MGLILCNTYITSFSSTEKIIRIIHGVKPLSHTDPLFLQSCILKVKEIYFYNLALFMYKYNLSLLPSMFQEMFTLNRDIHTYATRLSKHFHVPACRTNISKMSLRYQGSVFWNKLLVCIDIECSIGTFKKRVKANLMNNSQT